MTLVSDKCALSYSVKLFALYPHQVNESIALMSPSYSTVLWFSLYNYNLVFVKAKPTILGISVSPVAPANPSLPPSLSPQQYTSPA